MDSIIEDIKARVDIVDLIAEHVDLKTAGQNYKGLCPFHSEKTPSFMVSPYKQIFHCFGCHKGGDIFTFVMHYENMTFQEAVTYLAKRAGLKLESIKGRHSSGFKESLLAIQKEAMMFFKNNLKTSSQAIAYLKERQLSDVIEEFSIGYSKGEKDSLFKHLIGLGFSKEHIKASGLVVFKESSGLKSAYDFFRDRLMFPIFDLQGRVIAFGGRTLSSSKEIPKYINSPDSPLFKKGESCYAMNIAKNHITQKGYSIITEGYIDVIICHKYGFKNSVAPLGTALTQGQLIKLKRFSNNVLLLFDGDTAGISATKRSIELCYATGLNTKVLILPKGDDPDTFLRRHGADYFKRYMSKTASPLEFLLRTSGKSKLDAVRNILQIIAASPDPLQRDEAIRELSERSRINEITLREEFKDLIKKRQKMEYRRQGTDETEKSDMLTAVAKKEEQILLSIILSVPDKARAIINRINIDIIESPEIREIFGKIKTSVSEGMSVEKILNALSIEEQGLITGFSLNCIIDRDNIDIITDDCLKSLTLKDIERQIKQAGEKGDLISLQNLLNEKRKILSGLNIEAIETV